MLLTAAQVLRAVVDDGERLTRAMDTYRPAELSANDEAKADSKRMVQSTAKWTEICYGSCRFYIYLAAILETLLQKPLRARDRIIHFLLVGALYQLETMHTPPYAVVDQAVGALQSGAQAWASRLVNGVLRNFLRRRVAIKTALATAPPHIRYAMPHHFYHQLATAWPSHHPAIFTAANTKPPLTVRINQQRVSRADYRRMLGAAGIEHAPTPVSALGLTINPPRAVHQLPHFADGYASVQDESAQLILPAMQLRPNLRVLDACAAPGGKTALMLEAQPQLASMLALDRPARIGRLHENLTRLGLTARVLATTLQEFQQTWRGALFDRILLDVPCSGSGIIRRHPDIRHRRRPHDFAQFADQQQTLLACAWPLLAPDGLLLYVTCSLLPVENDEVVAKFQREISDFAVQSLGTEFGVATQFGRQRLPGVHSGDGFYYCQLTKSRSA